MKGFNSLQTGTHIQRRLLLKKVLQVKQVSIPFKRERISKVNKERINVVVHGFNSLQTGTHIQSWIRQERWWNFLSFNSLQTGTHIQSYTKYDDYDENDVMFQFPSNGNAYPKSASNAADPRNRTPPSFNSLQTGTHIQSLTFGLMFVNGYFLFQFPSNGNAYPKTHIPKHP